MNLIVLLKETRGGEVRRTRKSKKVQKKSQLQKNLVVGSLCCIALYTSAQMVTPTEAKFVSTKQVDGSFTTAFVFPKTISDMVSRAETLQGELAGYMVTEGFSTSEQGEQVVATLAGNRGSFASARDELNQLLKEMQGYSAEATRIVEMISTQLALYDVKDARENSAELNAIKENHDRGLQVQGYVEEGHSRLVAINNSASTMSDFDSLLNNLKKRVQELRAAEEKARLEKLKKEEEEKKKAEQAAKEKAEKEKAEKEQQSKQEKPSEPAKSEPTQQEPSPSQADPTANKNEQPIEVVDK
jgi:Domain of unknown function (DUF4047)